MSEPKREILCLNESAVASFSERGAKLMSEWVGATLGSDGIGRVSIYGGLGNGYFEAFSTYEEIAANIETLRNDDKCKSIALFINSPGGAAIGLSDLCSYISGCEKPIHAYVTGMACSAAYAIATACDSIWMQEDAETGCCGCYAHVLEAKDEAYEKAGFISRIFRSKNAPKKNLSINEEGVAEDYQSKVDELGDKYLSMVMQNRGIEDGKVFGEGAVVSASYALEVGMVDGICTVEDFIAHVTETTSSSQSESEGEDMDINQMSAEQQKEIFDMLCKANPSLVSERVEAAKKAESERVSALNALRGESDVVNAIVDAAVADGRTAESIAFDVINAMKEEVKVTNEKARKAALGAFAESTTDVPTPAVKSEDQLIEEMVSRM